MDSRAALLAAMITAVVVLLAPQSLAHAQAAGPYGGVAASVPSIETAPPGQSDDTNGHRDPFGPALVAPSFTDGFRTTRQLPENAEAGHAIGDPVTATHPNDLVITYSLTGPNAVHFSVDSGTGQLSLKKDMDLSVGNTYTMNLNATDSSNFGAIITVVVEVTEAVYDPYDANENGAIERDEVITAVQDYFAGVITRGQVIVLVQQYFAS